MPSQRSKARSSSCLLWFGSYKNATSCYAPGWVKTDGTRFPRVQIKGGDDKLVTISTLQPFSKELWQADATAFAALMKHVKEVDQGNGTVVMIQVENEIGIMGDSHECSAVANDLFGSPVPEDLLKRLRKDFDTLSPSFKSKFAPLKSTWEASLTWKQSFGADHWADDLFMAHAFSISFNKLGQPGAQSTAYPYSSTLLCVSRIRLGPMTSISLTLFPRVRSLASILLVDLSDTTWTFICIMPLASTSLLLTSISKTMRKSPSALDIRNGHYSSPSSDVMSTERGGSGLDTATMRLLVAVPSELTT